MGLVRKLVLLAAADGVLLQPVQTQGDQSLPRNLLIDYETHEVSLIHDGELQNEEEPSDKPKLECYGIVGVLKVSGFAYLLVITGRREVARIFRKPVYTVNHVSVIPIDSQENATNAILTAASESGCHTQHEQAENDDGAGAFEDNGNGMLTSLEDTWLDDEVFRRSSDNAEHLGTRTSGILGDVVARKGLYGGFADRWFWPKVWMGNLIKARKTTNTTEQRFGATLTPKLIETTKLMLTSSTFFFSYDVDVTRCLATQPRAQSKLPLHERVDPQYFWNVHLATPFIQHASPQFVLPLMQGFVGQRAFTLDMIKARSEMIPKVVPASDDAHSVHTAATKPQRALQKPFMLTIISRRSTRRAGLRYLRRGIDEAGNTANSVETEQIFSSPAWDDHPTHSFVQTRGSIPLFYSQLPYTFKPIPSLQGSREANQLAFKEHFMSLSKRYGRVHAVSLIDRHGGEASVGQCYEQHAQHLNKHGGLNGTRLDFVWFDFHDKCQGMKFENVSLLVQELSPSLSSFGYFTKNEDKVTSTQTGVIRTNCMDCLDRTNVVQSAIAQHVLAQQISCYLTDAHEDIDLTTQSFNVLWADNGDAISLSYAGTAALKGDYVRTRKRTSLGLLTDLSLTLSRYYRNLFDDFFAQAVIDYLLGYRDEDVFAEFQEHMMTSDPSFDLGRAREAAVVSAGDVVVPHEEDVVGGWTVSAPATVLTGSVLSLERVESRWPRGTLASVLRARPFRDVVLLLSDSAIYLVSYSWDKETVLGYERFELKNIKSLRWGTYITETLPAGRQTDSNRNAGVLIEYDVKKGKDVASDHAALLKDVRVNTGSLETLPNVINDKEKNAFPPQRNILAFKMLPKARTSNQYQPRHSRSPSTSARSTTGGAIGLSSIVASCIPLMRDTNSREPPSERMLARDICRDIVRSAKNANSAWKDQESDQQLHVTEQDVVSLGEAKRSTTVVEWLGYELKKLVWG